MKRTINPPELRGGDIVVGVDGTLALGPYHVTAIVSVESLGRRPGYLTDTHLVEARIRNGGGEVPAIFQAHTIQVDRAEA